MTIKQLLFAAAIGAGALAVTAGSAVADIACNADGDCWHTNSHYTYDPTFGVTVHPNDWHWGTNDHYRWHEHTGRGYWRSGAWVTF